VVASGPGRAALLPLLLRLRRSVLRRLTFGNGLLQVLKPKLQLVEVELLAPTAELMAEQALDQQPQRLVLSLTLLHGALQRRLLLLARGHHVPQHLLQDRGVVRQEVEVDLHSSTMPDTAVDTPMTPARSARKLRPAAINGRPPLASFQ